MDKLGCTALNEPSDTYLPVSVPKHDYDTVNLFFVQDRSSTSEYNNPSAPPVKGHLSKTCSEPAMGAVSNSDSIPDDLSSCDLNLSGQKLLWRATPKPPNAAQVSVVMLITSDKLSLY